MNCDSIARSYKWIEYAAFGRRLERHRFRFLPVLRDSRRALLLGEGDGRFVARLAGHNQTVEIDCIESSPRMISVATERLRSLGLSSPSRIRFLEMDVLNGEWPRARYDVIVTNFLLDCFAPAELSILVESVRGACLPDAQWVISEFEQPPRGWRSWHAALWLGTMYAFFGLAAKLRTRRLAPYEGLLRRSGFRLQAKQSSLFGLVRSELWTLSGSVTDAVSR